MEALAEGLDERAEVVIVGAGPVGLLMANYLGAQGIRVLLLERGAELIDYPRGVGMDDECLRSFQSVGLAQAVLPHTTPSHWMRFVTGKGRCFASIEPANDEFGWSRRNAFIQPLADRVLLQGLQRYPNVKVLFSCTLGSLSQTDAGVVLGVESDAGRGCIEAGYVVGCDGGRSTVRKLLDIPFEGETDSNRWIVIDLNNDPVGVPHAYVYCDPARPYVSIALPHGIRRFEFMLLEGEAKDDVVEPEVLRKMLGKVVPDPDHVDIIRARVYTHSARLATRFRDRRVLIAGDAAHIMPVWQGQGYNSGIRDATNLAWKLALVVKNVAGEALLDTYDEERREHARAMIALSQFVGRILAVTNPLLVRLRDGFTWLLNYIPPVKRYFVEMRFKPMPRYLHGALVYADGVDLHSPVGRMFIQPRVKAGPGEAATLLDEVLGDSFAIICWGGDPSYWMSDATLALWRSLGATLVSAWPETQFDYEAARQTGEVRVVGDIGGQLKEWFGNHSSNIVFLRPDRFVCAMCKSQQIDATTQKLAVALSLKNGVQHEPDEAAMSFA